MVFDVDSYYERVPDRKVRRDAIAEILEKQYGVKDGDLVEIVLKGGTGWRSQDGDEIPAYIYPGNKCKTVYEKGETLAGYLTTNIPLGGMEDFYLGLSMDKRRLGCELIELGAIKSIGLR